jgi:hypothetical protein
VATTNKIKNQIVAAFLILDMSGSMDQKVDNTPKEKLLRDGIQSYVESMNEKAPVSILVFGTHPENKCQDMIYKTMPAKDSLSYIETLRPGPYGRTPLGKAIRFVLEKLKNKKSDSLVIVTDGADTCHEDPCKIIREADPILGKKKIKLHLDLVGFDLRDEAKSFTCLQRIGKSLKSIDLKFHNEASSEGLIQSLVTSRSKQSLDTKMGSVQIDGAPYKVEFEARLKTDGTLSKKWKGSFESEIEPGDYELHLRNDSETRYPFTVVAEKQLHIPYGEIFQRKTGLVGFKERGFVVEATPVASTLVLHPKAVPQTLENGKAVALPFGSWKLTVVKPAWLDKKVEAEIQVERLQKKKLNLRTIFNNLSWFPVPPDMQKIYQIDGHKLIVLPNTVKEIPYKSGDEIVDISR